MLAREFSPSSFADLGTVGGATEVVQIRRVPPKNIHPKPELHAEQDISIANGWRAGRGKEHRYERFEKHWEN